MKCRNFWDSRLKVPTVGIIVVEVGVVVVDSEDDNEDDDDGGGGGGVEDDDVDEGVDDDVDDSGVGQTDFITLVYQDASPIGCLIALQPIMNRWFRC